MNRRSVAENGVLSATVTLFHSPSPEINDRFSVRLDREGADRGCPILMTGKVVIANDVLTIDPDRRLAWEPNPVRRQDRRAARN